MVFGMAHQSNVADIVADEIDIDSNAGYLWNSKRSHLTMFQRRIIELRLILDGSQSSGHHTGSQQSNQFDPRDDMLIKAVI
ncbi:hypothetical protein PGT21_018338 [Puccinia graminis f. sp. tritici]|uniref:Uncharacterized protein n=1 Tax=Puccinia graminis f. sp. tritici TaxID=56615 RepID=A0A5B0PLH5_PUCGR|nr:hypothetical protein PGT21_018338 [Puccinia graminis f. sp. tritici]